MSYIRFQESADSSMFALALGPVGLGMAKSPDGRVGFKFSLGGLEGACLAAEERHFELTKAWAKALSANQLRIYSVAYAAALDALELEDGEVAEAGAASAALVVRVIDREIDAREIEVGNLVLAA